MGSILLKIIHLTICNKIYIYMYIYEIYEKYIWNFSNVYRRHIQTINLYGTLKIYIGLNRYFYLQWENFWIKQMKEWPWKMLISILNTNFLCISLNCLKSNNTLLEYMETFQVKRETTLTIRTVVSFKHCD